MSTSAPDTARRHRLTVDDYHRMAEAGILTERDRVELIEGAIIDMTPIGSPHAAAVNRLTRLLVERVRGQAIVSVQNPVVLGRHSEPEPDLALLRPRDDDYAARHPSAADVLLLVEVSDTTLRYDRETKLPLYARHGIPEAWIVNLVERVIEVHREPRGGEYGLAEVRREGEVEVSQLPGCAVGVGEVCR